MRGQKLALAFAVVCIAALGCAHAEPMVEEPQAPTSATPAAASEGPPTTLHVSGAPIEALRSPYFAALEITFENPSSAWHEVRRVSLSPERQLFGTSFESLQGARLRAWQLAARDAHQGANGPIPIPLETLAPDAPASGEAGAAGSAGAPAQHLLAGAFIIAPGFATRKWVVLYSPTKDGLLGQDLLLAYELENGQVERALVQYPKPAPQH